MAYDESKKRNGCVPLTKGEKKRRPVGGSCWEEEKNKRRREEVVVVRNETGWESGRGERERRG